MIGVEQAFHEHFLGPREVARLSGMLGDLWEKYQTSKKVRVYTLESEFEQEYRHVVELYQLLGELEACGITLHDVMARKHTPTLLHFLVCCVVDRKKLLDLERWLHLQKPKQFEFVVA